MTYGIFWVLFSVAAGVYASNRRRSGIAWFVLPEAGVCKHCRATLAPAISHQQKQQQMARQAEAKDSTNLIMGVVCIVALFAVVGMISRF